MRPDPHSGAVFSCLLRWNIASSRSNMARLIEVKPAAKTRQQHLLSSVATIMKQWDSLTLRGSGGGRGARKAPICMIQMCFGSGPSWGPIYHVWVGAEGPGCLQLTSSFILLYVAVIHPRFSLVLFERLSTGASTLKITYSPSSLHLWAASLNSQTRNLVFWHVYKHHMTLVIVHIALYCCSTSRELDFQRNVFIFTNLSQQSCMFLCLY